MSRVSSNVVASDGSIWLVRPDEDEGGWSVLIRCDCSLGPHWHEQKWFSTKGESLKFIEESSS